MKVKELQEGLLDDVLTRIQNLAGGSIAGFFRGLGGGNAGLDLVVDQIAKDSERLLSVGQTNISQPGVELPMDKIIDTVFTNASKLSQSDREIKPITKDGLFKHLQQHKADILKGINAQAREAGLAPRVVDMIEQFIAGQPITGIENLDFKRTVRAVSLVAGVILLDFEFRALADISNNQPNKEIKFDSNTVQEFAQLGKQINSEVFAPGSSLQKLLRINDSLKTNLESLIVNGIIGKITNEYLQAPTEKMQEDATKPFFDNSDLRSVFVGHLDPNDPKLTPDVEAAIDDAATKKLKEFNDFIAKWFELALQERQQGNQDSRNAYKLLTNWAENALALVDRIKITTAPTKQTKAAPAGETSPSLEDRYTAANEYAQRAAARVPEDQADAAYMNAMDEYFKANPNP